MHTPSKMSGIRIYVLVMGSQTRDNEFCNLPILVNAQRSIQTPEPKNFRIKQQVTHEKTCEHTDQCLTD